MCAEMGELRVAFGPIKKLPARPAEQQIRWHQQNAEMGELRVAFRPVKKTPARPAGQQVHRHQKASRAAGGTARSKPAIRAAVEPANQAAVKPAIKPAIEHAVKPAIKHANQPARIARWTKSWSPRLRCFRLRGRVNRKSGRLPHKRSGDYHQTRHQHQVLPQANEWPTKHLFSPPSQRVQSEPRPARATASDRRYIQQELWR